MFKRGRCGGEGGVAYFNIDDSKAAIAVASTVASVSAVDLVKANNGDMVRINLSQK